MKFKSYLLLIAGLCAFGVAPLFSGDATKEVSAEDQFNYVDNNISEVKIIDGYAEGSKYMIITLKTSDFASAPKVNSGTNTDFNLDNDVNHDTHPLYNFRTVTNFASGNLKIGEYTYDGVGKCAYFRYKANDNSIGIELDSTDKSKIVEGCTLSFPAGTTFPSYKGMFVSGNNTLYKTTKAAEYVYKNGTFMMKTTSVDTEVTSVDFALGYNGSDYFVKFHLSVNDYSGIPYNNGNDFNLHNTAYVVNKFSTVSNFANNIFYKGSQTNLDNGNGTVYMNYRPLDGKYDSIGLRATNIKNSFTNLDEIKIPAGTTFPSYGIVVGANDIVYETTEDKVFTYFNGAFHCCEENISETFGKDSSGHWNTCTICGKKMNEENHHIVSGDKAPTCLEEGNANSQYCDICGYVEVEGTTIPALGHDFTGEWKSDPSNHWKECEHDGCTETDSIEEHTFNNDPHVCDTCGYTRDISIVTIVGGYINGSDDTAILKGDSITIIANSCENGKEFDGWYVGTEKLSSDSTYTITPDGDITITAVYKDVEFIDYAAIERDEEAEDNEETPSGCQSSIATSSIFICVLTTMGITLLKNKKDN